MNMRQASRSLKGHKLRTLLSTLGITVGVASVVAMISIGNGFRRAIDQQMASLNQNVLMIQPGTSSNRDLNSEALKLTVDTAQQMLSSLPQLESVIALSMGQVNVTQGGKIVQAPLLGVGAGFFASHSLQAMRGELETLDGNTEEQAAVLGSELAQDLFGRKDPIGQYIRINRSQFEIVGVLKKPEITIYDEDKSLFLTQKTAMRRVTGSPFIDVIEAIPRAGVSIKDLETEARGFLEETYKLPASLGKDAFKFVDYNSFREKVDKISLAIRIFLGVIASISLMVGGIGIANIMLVSVTERTREVGLRKALGARTLSIFHQFLVESMYICLLGGMLGAGLAAALCLSVSHMTDQIQAEVSLGTLALALGFSLVVGVIAGLFPAQRAAGLKPVEALRSH
jgi:ABC-type antimicrobial peptide transport system permease subunit